MIQPSASRSWRFAPCTRVPVALVAFAAATPAALADIHIGVTLSTTGPARVARHPGRAGAEDVAGRDGGEKVRFTILNDTTDTTIATKNAQRLIAEDKVDLIIGSSVTPTSLAWWRRPARRGCR